MMRWLLAAVAVTGTMFAVGWPEWHRSWDRRMSLEERDAANELDVDSSAMLNSLGPDPDRLTDRRRGFLLTGPPPPQGTTDPGSMLPSGRRIVTHFWIEHFEQSPDYRQMAVESAASFIPVASLAFLQLVAAGRRITPPSWRPSP